MEGKAENSCRRGAIVVKQLVLKTVENADQEVTLLNWLTRTVIERNHHRGFVWRSRCFKFYNCRFLLGFWFRHGLSFGMGAEILKRGRDRKLPSRILHRTLKLRKPKRFSQ